MTGTGLTFLAYWAFGLGSGFGVVLRSYFTGSGFNTGSSFNTGCSLSDFLFLGNLSNRGPFSFGLSGLSALLECFGGDLLGAEFYLLALLLILLVISGCRFVG